MNAAWCSGQHTWPHLKEPGLDTYSDLDLCRDCPTGHQGRGSLIKNCFNNMKCLVIIWFIHLTTVP